MPADEKKSRTYEEVALSSEVIQRGVDLVAPLSRILLRRSKDVKEFHSRTTDSEWEAFEKEFGITLPPDYKLLTNTVGTSGLWLNGRCVLTDPTELAKRIRSNVTGYGKWQVDGDAHQYVGVWKDQPGFHMEWGIDWEGNALSFYWCCAKSEHKGAWPVVQMELEAPLRHNGRLHCCTVTEILYRDVIDKDGMGDYDNDDDDDDDDEEEEQSDFEKIILGTEEEPRCVYQFARKGEPPKTKSKPSSDAESLEESIGKVGSEQDKKDMSLLNGAPDLEIIKDVKAKCVAMEPITVDVSKE